MKVIRYIACGLFVLMGLSSCKENFNEEVEEQIGSFLVSVETKNPENHKDKLNTRAASQNTSEFPVAIHGVKGTAVENIVREFPSLSSMPKDPVKLPVGRYVVSSHTPGELEKQMDYPYFAGSKEVDILKNVTSTTKVVCKMKNSKIQLTYEDLFKEIFESWRITIDDGSGSVIAFNEKNLTPAPVYYYFGDQGAQYLTMNVRAKTKAGNTIVKVIRLTKADAQESYEEDTPNFVGGDGLDLKMDIEQNPEGSAVIKVEIHILFTEHKDDVDIDVTDKEPALPEVPELPDVPGSNDNGGDNGGGDAQNGLQLELPADFTYSPSDGAIDADAVFVTPKGLQSAVVRIETDNEGFKGTLEQTAFDTPGALLEGTELIGNAAMQDLFSSLELTDESGQPKQTPRTGDTEYTFPLGAFSTFLGAFEGNHTFYLTLTDAEGATISKNLTIKVTM